MAERPATTTTQLEGTISAQQPALEAAEEAEDMPSLDQVAQVASDNCIACHTNQALLEQLAEEPEVVESELASGEG
jgi:mono/diheme cytochrome c family protein